MPLNLLSLFFEGGVAVVGTDDYYVTSYLLWSYGLLTNSTSADEGPKRRARVDGDGTPIRASGILSGLHSASGLQQHFSV